MFTSLLDLFLPARCVGCGGEESPFCRACRRSLPRTVLQVTALPRVPPVWAAGRYEGPLRTALLAYKERGRRELRRMLGELLALAVAAAAHARCHSSARLAIVAVPSRRSVARRRGGDHLGKLARSAAAELRGQGRDAVVVPALRLTRSPRDSARLTAAARALNLAGAFQVAWGGAANRAIGGRRRSPAELAGRQVVLVDDIVTTGSTLEEAARALRAAHVPVMAAAVVAVTPRRRSRQLPPVASADVRAAGIEPLPG